MGRALAVADAEGLDALTIRRLAADLDVTPMALYWHFRDKDELLDALAEHLFRSVRLPDAQEGGWAEQLRATLAALMGALRPHPAVAALTRTRILSSHAGLALAERALGLLDEAGFGTEEAAEVGGYLVAAVVTLVTAEPGAGHGPDPEVRDAAVRAQRATLLSLAPHDYPHVVAAADALASCADDDAYFSRGLDLLIAGVQGLHPGKG
ncbi:TetR family transcriptional regulator ActII [Pseudonocardia xinjiangensis]